MRAMIKIMAAHYQQKKHVTRYLVIYYRSVVQTCPPSSLATFAEGSLHVQCQVRFGWGEISVEAGSSSFGIFHTSQHSARCILSDNGETERRQCPFHDTSAVLHQYTISTNTSVSSLSMSSIGAPAATTCFQHIADQSYVGIVILSTLTMVSVRLTSSMLLPMSCVQISCGSWRLLALFFIITSRPARGEVLVM